MSKNWLDAFSHLLAPPSLFGERIAEAPAPREAIEQVQDYLGTAVVYADGRRIRERDARATLKLLERL